MELNKTRFKKGIICSSVVIGLFLLYCLSEMIVSWCVDYSYYYMNGRFVALASLFVLAIVFSTQYKNMGVAPIFVCLALFFSIGIDFLKAGGVSAFFASSTNVNYIKIFPFIIHFQKFRDLSHPQNAWATDENLDLLRFNTINIIFTVAVLLGAIVLIVALLIKKSKLDIDKATKVMSGITLGSTLFLFIEFMRCLFALVVTK